MKIHFRFHQMTNSKIIIISWSKACMYILRKFCGEKNALKCCGLHDVLMLFFVTSMSKKPENGVKLLCVSYQKIYEMAYIKGISCNKHDWNHILQVTGTECSITWDPRHWRKVLDTLSSAMNLLRRCRVNAALTIQLFSQLFHFINMWLFNILVKEQHHQFCARVWGVRLKRRLGSIEAWAEKQGLELAADCHLCRISQVCVVLCVCVWGGGGMGVRLKRRLGSIEAWAEKQGLELAADCHLCRISQVCVVLCVCVCGGGGVWASDWNAGWAA